MAGPMGHNGKALADGYRRDVLGGFEQEKPRYNSVSPRRGESGKNLPNPLTNPACVRR